MDTKLLENKFARMGARLEVADSRFSGRVALDVLEGRKGEFFRITRPQEAEVDVLDLQSAERHLLLLVRDQGVKSKFLCGHDERHWFIAAIPEAAPVGTVRQAKEALKPVEVRRAQAPHGLRARAQGSRKNAAYVRQGEWFFLPVARLVVDDRWIFRDEPLSRGRSKPHIAQFCCRVGGELVYVCSRYAAGVSPVAYRRIVSRNPEARGWGWRLMGRNPDVYVRGRIRHADHKTIVLHTWHRVLMNTEFRARAMANVAFLD